MSRYYVLEAVEANIGTFLGKMYLDDDLSLIRLYGAEHSLCNGEIQPIATRRLNGDLSSWSVRVGSLLDNSHIMANWRDGV